MYNRIFTWSSSNTLSNHSPFSFLEAEPIRLDEHKNHHLTLQLILTQGQGMTVNKIKASKKQDIHTPMSLHEMAEQIRMFTIANDIFFGKLSIGSQLLCSLQTMIDRMRSTFKAWECLDTEFYAEFLFAVDTCYQIWLKQCKIAQS